MTTRIRILILLLLAMVCFAIVTTSGLAYNHYAIHYGRHGWGPPEVAFLLHYLLFGATSVVLLGVALDLAMGRRLTEAFDRLATLSARSAWSLTALASVLVFGLVTLSRYGLLGDTAITDDENVYTFMARTFASGRLYLESMPEPVRPFFNNQFIINDGKWYGIYFPGHSALLALGERFHLMHWVTHAVGGPDRRADVCGRPPHVRPASRADWPCRFSRSPRSSSCPRRPCSATRRPGSCSWPSSTRPSGCWSSPSAWSGGWRPGWPLEGPASPGRSRPRPSLFPGWSCSPCHCAAAPGAAPGPRPRSSV